MIQRWQLVQELFEETVALDAPERARVLRERASGDGELVQGVEALVSADAAPLPDFERTATALLEELRDEPPAADLCGTEFGPYRVEEHVASGGMGHVYRATRSSAGTERRVALKVLRHSLDTEALLQRFRRERETLAALEHENVVSFLDAGALPDGRPYLVMEYVEGIPLTHWGRAVPLRARLELFQQVLAAVQYAHQRLVVHCDLKPSNVLVTPQGTPKLLDFGVAAALGAAERAASGRDAGARAPLTPAYASPEALRGEPPTTASDVYSLGVLLCELVSGELPGSGPEGPSVKVAGGLGAIVRQAVVTEPARRYRSADQMADDVRRYLAREPVLARPASWLYRSALFVARNRWPLALAAAVVLALALGWIGSDLERRAAEREAGRGWSAHAQAKLTARVFEGWIASVTAADPDLRAAAAAHLEVAVRDELAAYPEAETLVRLTLADLYLQQGERERAAVHAERAFELARSTPGVGERERERAAALRERVRAGG